MGDRGVNIDLAPGDDVICTFTNKKPGSITVVKDADPADDTVFNFGLVGGDAMERGSRLQVPAGPQRPSPASFLASGAWERMRWPAGS